MADIANFTDEDRAAVVVRCLAGEKEESLAAELGVPVGVVEGWVRKVADSLKHKQVSEGEIAKDRELQEDIKDKQGEIDELRSKVEATKKVYEAQKTILNARMTKHIFDR